MAFNLEMELNVSGLIQAVLTGVTLCHHRQFYQHPVQLAPDYHRHGGRDCNVISRFHIFKKE